MGFAYNCNDSMKFSEPTTASHPLEPAATGNQEEEPITKRRKMTEANLDNVAMIDASSMASSSSTANGSSNNLQTMDVDCQSTTSTSTTVTTHATNVTTAASSSSSSSSRPYHPSSTNHFDGNALSDEELVYQVLGSGAQTYAECVQFCVARGIPVSRVLEMDLVRRLSYLRAS